MRRGVVGLQPQGLAFNSLNKKKARKSLDRMVEKQWVCNSDACSSDGQQAEDSSSQFLWNRQLEDEFTTTFLIQENFNH